MAQQQLGIDGSFPSLWGQEGGSSFPNTAVGCLEHGAAPSSLLTLLLARWKPLNLGTGWNLMDFRESGCKSRAVTKFTV